MSDRDKVQSAATGVHAGYKAKFDDIGAKHISFSIWHGDKQASGHQCYWLVEFERFSHDDLVEIIRSLLYRTST